MSNRCNKLKWHEANLMKLLRSSCLSLCFWFYQPVNNTEFPKKEYGEFLSLKTNQRCIFSTCQTFKIELLWKYSKASKKLTILFLQKFRSQMLDRVLNTPLGFLYKWCYIDFSLFAFYGASTYYVISFLTKFHPSHCNQV